jgi:hypothetical protein
MTCYLPYGVERFLCIATTIIMCIITGILALALIMGSGFLLGFLLREAWNSECWNSVKQFVGEASNYVFSNLMVRPSWDDEISARISKLEADMVRLMAVLEENKAEVCYPPDP